MKSGSKVWEVVRKRRQSATEGQVSPPEQVKDGSYYIKEALMFSLWNFLCCPSPFTWQRFLSSLYTISLCPSFSLRWRRCVLRPVVEVINVTCALSSPPLDWLALHFLIRFHCNMSPLLFLTPACWQGRAEATQALAAAEAQNMLWWRIMQTSNRLVDFLHQSALSLRSGRESVKESRDTSDGPSQVLTTTVKKVCLFNHLCSKR